MTATLVSFTTDEPAAKERQLKDRWRQCYDELRTTARAGVLAPRGGGPTKDALESMWHAHERYTRHRCAGYWIAWMTRSVRRSSSSCTGRPELSCGTPAN